jgi:hypothetical protein
LGEDSLAHHLLLVVSLQPDPLRVLLVVLLLRQRGSGDERRSLDIITLRRHGHVNLVGDSLESVPPQLLLDSVSEQSVTRLVSDVDDTLLGVSRGLNAGHFGKVDNLVHERSGLGGEFVQSQDVDLVDDQNDGLVVEQGLDRVEKLALSLDSVSTLLGNVHKVEDRGSQVSERGDGLHLDGGELLQRSVCGRRTRSVRCSFLP